VELFGLHRIRIKLISEKPGNKFFSSLVLHNDDTVEQDE